MIKKSILLAVCMLCFIGKANAQWAVFDPVQNIFQYTLSIKNWWKETEEFTQRFQQAKELMEDVKQVGSYVQDSKELLIAADNARVIGTYNVETVSLLANYQSILPPAIAQQYNMDHVIDLLTKNTRSATESVINLNKVAYGIIGGKSGTLNTAERKQIIMDESANLSQLKLMAKEIRGNYFNSISKEVSQVAARNNLGQLFSTYNNRMIVGNQHDY